MSREIKIIRIIKAPLKKVFAALTNQEEVAGYTGDCIIELKNGGKIEMFDGWVKGEVKEYELNKKFAYTWHIAEWDDKTSVSLVVYTFSAKGNDTEILLEHNNLPSDKEAKSHEQGWKILFLGLWKIIWEFKITFFFSRLLGFVLNGKNENTTTSFS